MGGSGCSTSGGASHRTTGSASRFEGKINAQGVAAAHSSGSKKAKAERQKRSKGKLVKRTSEKMNERVLDSLDGPGGMFGRVTKMVGGKSVRVVLDDDSEVTVVMRGLLRDRRRTPIEVGSVLLLSGGPGQGWDAVAVIDDRAAGAIAHVGKMPVWMAAGGARPSEKEEDDIFDREVPLPVDEEGNIIVDKSDLAQSIMYMFATATTGGGAGDRHESKTFAIATTWGGAGDSHERKDDEEINIDDI